ncbi:hypothetical protein [Aquabacterium sp.]|uniref:hypothetical protein n=1 Tax=Aquabacterium sp. TaxID=1872578 RepID=UPI003783D1B8
MPEARNPLLLMRLARARRAPRSPDPADMGTAFGLDFILDEAAADGSSDPVSDASPAAEWFRRWLPAKPAR